MPWKNEKYLHTPQTSQSHKVSASGPASALSLSEYGSEADNVKKIHSFHWQKYGLNKSTIHKFVRPPVVKIKGTVFRGIVLRKAMAEIFKLKNSSFYDGTSIRRFV